MIQVQNQAVWEQRLANITGLSFLEQVSRQDKEDIQNIDMQSLEHPEYTTIKNKKILFVVAVLFVVLCLALWALAFGHSVVGRITKGTDFRANVCGEEGLTGRKYLYYPTILKFAEFSICTTQCPGAIASYVCLYNINGTEYDFSTQEHLCYQTIQSKSIGKYCFPYESISSAYLSAYLNQPALRLNRIASDVGNSYPTILVCVICAVGLAILVNTVLMHRAKFLKTLGWLLLGMNLLLILVGAILAFASYSNYVKLYCISQLGNENEECVFGEVITYKVLSFAIISIAGVYIALNLILLKRAKATINLEVLSNIFSSVKKHLLASFIFLGLCLALLLFFGSALLMSLSDSQIVQQNISTIDSGIVNTLVYHNRRYWVFGFVLFACVISIKVVQKIHYFLIAVEFEAELTKRELLFSIVAHFGELFAVALMSTILYPLKLLSKCLYWFFKQVDQRSSPTRFLQSHVVFHPFLWLHVRVLRYLNDEVMALLPHSSSLPVQLRLYYLLKQSLDPACGELPSSLRFCCSHLQLSLCLLSCLAASALQWALCLAPIENPLTVPVTTFIVSFLITPQFVDQRVILMEVIFTKHQILAQAAKDVDALRNQYWPMFEPQQGTQQREPTKQHLDQPTEQDLGRHHQAQIPNESQFMQQ